MRGYVLEVLRILRGTLKARQKLLAAEAVEQWYWVAVT